MADAEKKAITVALLQERTAQTMSDEDRKHCVTVILESFLEVMFHRSKRGGDCIDVNLELNQSDMSPEAYNQVAPLCESFKARGELIYRLKQMGFLVLTPRTDLLKFTIHW